MQQPQTQRHTTTTSDDSCSSFVRYYTDLRHSITLYYGSDGSGTDDILIFHVVTIDSHDEMVLFVFDDGVSWSDWHLHHFLQWLLFFFAAWAFSITRKNSQKRQANRKLHLAVYASIIVFYTYSHRSVFRPQSLVISSSEPRDWHANGNWFLKD